MCIGEVYGFSVFNVPLTRVLGVSQSLEGQDWTIPQIGWIYQIALFMLGISAAVFGKWVEKSGPRKSMVVSMLCFCGGLMVSSVGVYLHRIELLYLGYGVLGGIGLGIGYIAPVSTLMKWFPDRPGMATGMAIMGFGGGALIGAPLGVQLMEVFKGANSVGVAEAFAAMAALYALSMMYGAWIVRVPAEGWQPGSSAARNESASAKNAVVSGQPQVSVDVAWRTPQFWCLWVVLCMNVSAGIGILGQASLMCQDMFGVSAAIGGGFAGLLSIFNMGGRFVWSFFSDLIGRRAVYCIFFLLGGVLYCLVPLTQKMGSQALFVVVTALIISMYGGGFATIPAYLKDLFGTLQVGAIHGRLITAWSMAAVIGPALVNYISVAQKKSGVPAAEAYNRTMYIVAALLILGLVANLMVRPVDPKFYHKPKPVE